MGKTKKHLVTTISILIPVAFASFFFLWKLSQLPPGLSSDEADFGMIALRILHGDWLQVSEFGLLLSYFEAPAIWLMGRTPLSLRLPTALEGIATVVVLYFWAWEMFKNRFVAATAATIYAITPEMQHLHRLAFPTAPMPLMQVLTYYFFWRGWNRNEKWSYALSGAFLGLEINTYQSSLALPLAMGIFWAGVLWFKRQEIKRQLTPLLLFWAAFLIPAIPFIVKVLPAMPYTKSSRYNHQSIFNPQVNKGRFLHILWLQLKDQAYLFGVRGDFIGRHNLPGRPLFDPLISALFWPGLLVVLKRIKDSRYSFLLVNFIVMFLPSLVSRAGTGPTLTHFAGILVLSTVFPALFLEWLRKKLWKARAARFAFATGLAVLLLFESWSTYHQYFDLWALHIQGRPGTNDSPMAFDEVFVRAAEQLNRDSSKVDVWILEKEASKPDWLHPSSFSFIYTAPKPAYFLQDNEKLASERLPRYLSGARHVGLVTWNPEKLKWAASVYWDEKHVLECLLARASKNEMKRDFNGFSITFYDLADKPSFSLPEASGQKAVFGNFLSVGDISYWQEGMADGKIVPGKPAWFAFRWQASAAPHRKLNSALSLFDLGGNSILHHDSPILSFDDRDTSKWKPGDWGWSCRKVMIPEGVKPGNHQAGMAAYDVSNGLKLPVTNGDKLTARDALVNAWHVAPPMGVQPPKRVVGVPIGKALVLRKYDKGSSTVSSGSKSIYAFHWQKLAPFHSGEVTISMEKDGKRAHSQTFEIGYGYPPDEWKIGQIVTDRFVLKVPRDLPGGTYHLKAVVYIDGSQAKALSLGDVHVAAWPRLERPYVWRNGIELVGYSLGSAVPGQQFPVCLCWHPTKAPQGSFVMFVHLLDRSGKLMAQVDSVPGGGSRPTTGWLPGEFICDRYSIALPKSLPPGIYSLEVGMYDQKFEQRVEIVDSSGKSIGSSAILTKVKVAK